jgi:hypothetical protein
MNMDKVSGPISIMIGALSLSLAPTEKVPDKILIATLQFLSDPVGGA